VVGYLKQLDSYSIEAGFRVLVVSSLSSKADLRHFVQKYFRHQDTKTQRLILQTVLLYALVVIFPVYPG
jgi:hypothetical protein